MANLGQFGGERRQRMALWSTALAIIIFSIAYFSPNSSTMSDSRYSLLVSQALIRHRTIRLDIYYDQLKTSFSEDHDYRLGEINGHIYYMYPLGSSFLSVPFVGLLNWLGYDMLIPSTEAAANNLLSAVVVVALFILVYKIATYYLPPTFSILIAGIAILGTTFMSSLGAALWNLDYAILFICLSLWLLVHLEDHDVSPVTPYLMGIFLFLAYFCRPTAAIFIGLILLYLFLKHRKYFLPTALTAFVLLMGFSLFSREVLGLWLPPYYLPRQLGGIHNYDEQAATPFFIALFALLFSPSRGLFIFSPVLCLVMGYAFHYWQVLKRQPLFWFIFSWIAFHLFAVARFHNWWGGYSFGPRLLTDMVPALILLAILVGHAWLKDEKRRYSAVSLGLLAVTAIISIYIHSYIGMFRPEVALSHGHSIPPSVDKASYLLLDWRYPQFLIDTDAMCLRNRVYHEDMLADQRIFLQSYTLGREITYKQATAVQRVRERPWQPSSVTVETSNSSQAGSVSGEKQFLPLIKTLGAPSVSALFVGWARPAEKGIWSTCAQSEIMIGSLPPDSLQEELVLEIRGRGYGSQLVMLYVNGKLIGELNFSDEFGSHQSTLPASLFHSDQYNHITLEFPDAVPPENDLSKLGIFLERIMLYEKS